ncbi:LuxR C-terminal-related transcriptional regulator [Cellulosimicrobium cellulans]|uniref:LuxR C-terminal-related transcriptional regulator n=1 Tax=Cellulosimicrobium cellulans TaxID=1710 RepID=UPI00381D707E
MTHARDAPPTTREVVHTLESGHLDEIEAVFDSLWFDLPDRFADEVLRAMMHLPPVVIDQRPRLAHLSLLAQMRMSHAGGDEEGMARVLQLYDRAGLRYAKRLNDFSRLQDLLAAGTAAVIAHRRRREYETSEKIGNWTDARTANASPRSMLPWTAADPGTRPGWLNAQRGITAMLAGAADVAITLLTRAREEAGDEPHAHYARLVAASHLALLSALHGHHDLAREHLGCLEHAPPFPEWTAEAQVGAEMIARAQIAIDEADPDTALRLLTTLRRSAPHLRELWGFLAFTRASYQAHYGEPLRGLRELDEARLLHGMIEPDLDTITGRLILKAEAKLLLRAGGARRVIHLAHAHDREDAVWFVSQHAWAHLTVGETHEAIRLASTALQGSRLPPADALDLHVVLAVANLRAGREDRARTWFQRALRQRATPKHAAPFLAMRPQERETLTQLTGAPNVLPDIAAPASNAPKIVLATPLSPRERAVLEALGEGYTAESAAAKFSVSVNTVRTQIRNIYRKLGVSSRRELVTTAHELGLFHTQSPTDQPGA